MAGLDLPVPERELTLGSFIAGAVSRFADREALLFEGRRYSYSELGAEVRRAAKAILALGVVKGARVGVLVANRPEFVFAVFGAASVGAVVIPVSTMAAPRELDHVFRHSDTSILVVEPEIHHHRELDELVSRHPDLAADEIRCAEFPFLRRVVALGKPWDAALAAGEDVSDAILGAAVSEVFPSDDAMIIYTSGTTAEPKAVLHRHRAPCVLAWRWLQQLKLEPFDRVWTSFPFFWTAGFSMSLCGTLVAGATLVLQEMVDAGAALELIERERVTTLHAFPHTHALLTDHPDAARRDLSSLRNVPDDSPLREAARLRPGGGDPRAAYGLSETFTIATSIPSDSPDELRARTHGLPLPGMSIRIAGAATAGEVGEILVKGVSLMRGYYKADPEHSFDPEGWFHTGDAGYLDERGYLHWTGRITDLIKTGGANVSPVEVEKKVAEQGLFGMSVVVGVPHPTLGEAVVLCAVPMTVGPVDTADVTNRLREVLSHFKVPRRILLFEEGELDFTASDKVRTAALRELAAERIAGDPSDAPWAEFLRRDR